MRIINTPGGVYIRKPFKPVCPDLRTIIGTGARVETTLLAGGVYACLITPNRGNAWYCEPQLGLSRLSSLSAALKALAKVNAEWLRMVRREWYWANDGSRFLEMRHYLTSWGNE